MVKRMKAKEEEMLQGLMKGMGKKRKGRMVSAEVVAKDEEGLKEGLGKAKEVLDSDEDVEKEDKMEMDVDKMSKEELKKELMKLRKK